MKKTFFIILAIIATYLIKSFNSSEQTADFTQSALCSEIEDGGIQRIDYIGYSLGYSKEKMAPLWVAYRLFKIESADSKERPGEFTEDHRIVGARANTRMWTGTGYDRGHMAPNWGISTRYGRDAQVETFHLSNIIAQKPDLNRGLWKSLEGIEANDYANRFSSIHVITGPIFTNNDRLKGENSPVIPTACYKIIIRDKEPRLLSFIIPQETPGSNSQKELVKYISNVSTVENQTGLKFNLPYSESSSLW